MSAVRTTAGKLDIVAIGVRDAANVPKTVSAGSVRNAASALKAFFSALSATVTPVDPDQVTGVGSSSSDLEIGTDAAVATPVGGIGPYTYAWEAVDATGWTALTPTAAACAFKSPPVPPFESETGSFRCKVTDSTGAEAYTPNVVANVINIGGTGGLIP